MAVKKLTGVTAEQLAQLKAGNFEPMARVYKIKEDLLTIPAGYWQHETRTISPKAGKPFTLELALFKVGNETFERPFRSGEELSEDNEIKVSIYVAERDETTSSGYVIKKGTMKQFAANA